MSGHQDTINSCAYSNSSRFAVTASSDRSIKTWDCVKGIQISSMSSTSSVYAVDISISDTMISSGHRDGSVRVWSVRDHKLIKEIKDSHDDCITALQYMPDSNQIITNSRDNTLKLIDTRTFEVLHTFEHENYTNSNDTNTIGVSSFGTYVSVGSKNGSLLIFNIKNMEFEEMFTNEHTTSIVGCSW